MDLLNTVGVIGAVVFVGAYLFLQAGVIRGQGYTYAGFNVVAGFLILISLIENFNLSSLLTNVAFILISLFGMYRFYMLNRRSLFTLEEQAAVDVLLPTLSPYEARQVLDLGRWRRAEPGMMLTEQDKIPDHVYFILRGSASVTVSDVHVAELGPCALIGEMSYMTGSPASASVSLSAPSRLFSLAVKDLNELLTRESGIRHEIQARFASHISYNLTQANAALADK